MFVCIVLMKPSTVVETVRPVLVRLLTSWATACSRVVTAVAIEASNAVRPAAVGAVVVVAVARSADNGRGIRRAEGLERRLHSFGVGVQGAIPGSTAAATTFATTERETLAATERETTTTAQGYSATTVTMREVAGNDRTGDVPRRVPGQNSTEPGGLPDLQGES